MTSFDPQDPQGKGSFASLLQQKAEKRARFRAAHAGREKEMSWLEMVGWGSSRVGEGLLTVAQAGLADVPIGVYNLTAGHLTGKIPRDVVNFQNLGFLASDLTGKLLSTVGGPDVEFGHAKGFDERLHAKAIERSYEVGGINMAEAGRFSLNSAGMLYGSIKYLPGMVWGKVGGWVTPIATKFVGNRMTGMAVGLGVAQTRAGAAVMAKNGTLYPSVIRALGKGQKLKKAGYEFAANWPGLASGFAVESFLRGGPIAGEVTGDSLKERTKQALHGALFSVGLWWAQRAANAVQGSVLQKYLKDGKWSEKTAVNFAAFAGGSTEALGFTMLDVRNFWAPMVRLIHNGDTEGLSRMLGEYAGNMSVLWKMRGMSIRNMRRMEAEELRPNWFKEMLKEPDPLDLAVAGITRDRLITPEMPGAEQPGKMGEHFRPVPNEVAEAWDSLYQSGWTSQQGKERLSGVFTLPGWRGKVSVSHEDAPAQLHGGQVRVVVPNDMARRIEPDRKGKGDAIYVGKEAVEAIERLVLVGNADAARGRLHFSRHMSEESDKPGVWVLPFATQEMVFYNGKIRYRTIGQKKWETMDAEQVTKLETEAIEDRQPLDAETGEAITMWENFLAAHIATHDTKIHAAEHLAIDAALKTAEHGDHNDAGVREIRALVKDPSLAPLVDPMHIRTVAKILSSTAAGYKNADRAVELAAALRARAQAEAAATEAKGDKPEAREEQVAREKDVTGPVSLRTKHFLSERKLALQEEASRHRPKAEKAALKVREAKLADKGVSKAEMEHAGLVAEQERLDLRAKAGGAREVTETMGDITDAIRELNQKIRKERAKAHPDKRKVQKFQAARKNLEQTQQDLRHELGRREIKAKKEEQEMLKEAEEGAIAGEKGEAERKVAEMLKKEQKDLKGEEEEEKKGAGGLLMVVGPQTLHKIGAAITKVAEDFRGLTDMPGAEQARNISQQVVRLNLGNKHKAEFIHGVEKMDAKFKKFLGPVELLRRKRFTAKQLKDAIHLMEETGNFEGESYSDLVKRYKAEKPELLEYAKEARKILDEAFKLLVEYQKLAGGEGELNYIENYVQHIYKKPTSKIRAKAWSSFVRDFAQVKKRRFANYLEAKAEGFEPLYDNLPDLIEHTQNSIASVRANKVTVDTLMAYRLVDGRYIIMAADPKTKKAPEGYMRIDHPAMRFHGEGLVIEGGKVVRKEGMQQFYIHPDAHQAVMKLLDVTAAPGKFANAVFLVNQLSKQINLMSSLFHPGALIESGIASALAPMFYGSLKIKRVPNPLSYAGRGLKLLKDGGADRLVQQGLQVGAPEDTSRYVLDRFIDGIGKVVEKGGVAGKVLSAGTIRTAEAVKHMQDRGLWDYLHVGLKVMTGDRILQARYEQLIRILDKKGEILTEEMKDEVAKDVAQAMNNQFGGQAWKLYWKLNTKTPRLAQLAILAPDWATSVILSAAMSGAAWVPVFRKGKYGGTTMGFGPEHTRAAFRAYGVGMTILAGMANSVAQFMWMTFSPWVTDEERARIKKEQGSFFPWDNDYGKKDKVLIGFNEKGQKMYAGPWKQGTEIARLLTEPQKYWGAKASPVMRTIFGFMLDHTLTDYPQPWKGKDYWDSMPERIVHLLGENFVPFSWDFDTQFALTYPMSTGMSNYRSTHFFEKIIQNYAKSGNPEDLNEMQKISEATRNNNLDPRDTFSEALRRQRGAALITMMEAINTQNIDLMNRTADALARLGMTMTGAERSLITKYERLVATGQAEVSEEAVRAGIGKLRGRQEEGEDITRIRSMMQTKLVREGAPFGGGREEVRRIYGSTVSDILSQGRKEHAESGFRSRRSLQNASLEAADYVLRNWRDAAPEILPAREAAMWSRMPEDRKRATVAAYFYRRRLLPQAKADRRRARTGPRKEARESRLRSLIR